MECAPRFTAGIQAARSHGNGRTFGHERSRGKMELPAKCGAVVPPHCECGQCGGVKVQEERGERFKVHNVKAAIPESCAIFFVDTFFLLTWFICTYMCFLSNAKSMQEF